MDLIRTIYKELFNVKLLHKAYSSAKGNSIFNEIQVVPDENSRALFKRSEMDYRCMDNMIVCFIRSELLSPPAKEPKKSYVLLVEAFKIRFLLKATKGFLDKTHVASTGSKTVYYFNNKINNVQSSNKYITKIIENFNAASSYDAGTIVNSAGASFAALQPVKSTDAIAITNIAYWKKVLPVEQVVNNADLQDTAAVKPTENCFAVVDIFNTGTINTTYNLFGSSLQLLSPLYTIPFKSKI